MSEESWHAEVLAELRAIRAAIERIVPIAQVSPLRFMPSDEPFEHQSIIPAKDFPDWFK